MINMKQNDYDRLTYLSKKALIDPISKEELKEFNQLMNDWSHSTEFNLLQGFHEHQST